MILNIGWMLSVACLSATVCLAECESSIGRVGLWRTNRYELGPENPTPISWRRAQSWRIRIDLVDPGSDGCRARIVVGDGEWRLVQVIEIDAINPYRWTRQINGETVFLEVEGCDDGGYPQLETTNQVVYRSDRNLRTYSIAGDDPRWVDLYGTPKERSSVPGKLRKNGDFVGVLWGFTKRTQSAWTCSGLLVGSRYFLTNWHCGGLPGAPGQQMWVNTDRIFVDLSWDGAGLGREYLVAEKLAGSENLDYALLSLTSICRPFRRTPLPIRPKPSRFCGC